MLSYVLAGLALGSIYAIAAGSLVITYVASGVFNLAFAAMAFATARVYYALHVEAGWDILPSAFVSLVVFSPLLGVTLYLLLFRFLAGRSTVVKLMATVGLSVALPPLVELVFGKLTAVTAPGLAPMPLDVFRFWGATVNGDQLMMYAGLIVVLIFGVGVLKFTDVGLKVRAMVDSQAMTSLSGTNPVSISAGVWAVSSMLAGLAGILIAPSAGLTPFGMTTLMTAAFAAVVAAGLRSLPIAVIVGLAMGLVTTVPQKWIQPDGAFAQAFIPSVPFLFILVALVYYGIRGMASDGMSGGALDKAIAVGGGDPTAVPTAALKIGKLPMGVVLGGALIVAVFISATIMDDYWAGLLASGIALGVILLSYTLVTGEGGMIWLCQITFAGIGALIIGQLATEHGWNPLLAAVLGPLLVVPVGVILGALTIKLGELYIALVTLTAGLLAQTLLITEEKFYNYGTGVAVPRPDFAVDNQEFAIFALVVFGVVSLLVINLRRSTTGLMMAAVRSSDNASRMLGINPVGAKLLISGLATYVAALGGAMLAMVYQTTLPDSYAPFAGMIWLAVLMTLGSRSVMAALLAGLLYALMPGVVGAYLPHSFGEIPVILFGLGAVALAAHPEGAIAQVGGDIARKRAAKAEKRAARSGVNSAAPVAAGAAVPTRERV